MKAIARKLLNRLGYDIRKINREEPEVSIFQIAFTTLMGTRTRASVVQVGANDGLLNDPLYPLIRRFAERTKVFLIEPQRALIPYLTKNYKFHSDSIIHNGAIGQEGALELYAVKEEAWPQLSVPYAKNWPAYRAPTGVTSASRAHVNAWLKRFYKGGAHIDEVIEKISVPYTPLIPLLADHGWGDEPIDVLQVDAEGYDDQVIYACAIEKTKPHLINFEWECMNSIAQNEIRNYLESHGYVLYPYNNRDMLAIASGIKLS